MAKCVPCMSQDLKDFIKTQFDVDDMLDDIPVCSPGTIMDMCSGPGAGSKGGRGKSEYQVFIGECLKEHKDGGQPITERMKGCALKWRQSKQESSPRVTDQSPQS